MVRISNDHIVGFVAGAGTAAVAFYWYDQNRDRVDAYLRAQGMAPSQPWERGVRYSAPAGYPTGDGATPTLEELMAQKERLEDMIAELLAAQREGTPEKAV